MASEASRSPVAQGVRRRDVWMRRLMSVICIVIGGVFVYAGIAKIRQPYDFLSGVYAYRLFTREQGVLIALLIPPLEIVTGLALFSGSHLRAGLLISTVLSAAFIFVRGWVVQTGVQADCNCFGAQVLFSSMTIDWRSVVLSSILFIASSVALVISLTVVARPDDRVPETP